MRGPYEQWCYYTIVLSQPCYDLFDEDILRKNNYMNIQKDGKFVGVDPVTDLTHRPWLRAPRNSFL